MSVQKLLMILIDENDTFGDLSLYEAICRRLVELGAPGVTVQTGIMGFGANQKIHRKRLFGVPDDRPVSIMVVDDEQALRGKILPVVRSMVTEGLVFLVDVEVIPPAAGE
jgi:PII-like signaling protein